MRKTNRARYRKAEDWVKVAEKLASDNGGLLPNVQWLITNDYWALYQQMRRHKQLYKHIKQEKKVRTTYHRRHKKTA